MFDQIVILIPLLPLIAVLVNGLNVMLGRRYSDGIAHRLAWGSVLLSFVCSLWVCQQVLRDPTPRTVIVYRWFFGGDLQVNMGCLVDSLTCVMLLVVTGVGFLIHVYSVGYMHGEEGFARFFTYMNLFMVSMLLLVMGNNYVVLFIGWEGVGLCSYLLIGYYYDRVSAAQAATKAFVVNRIGDAGFLIAIFLVFANFQTLDYAQVFAQADKLSSGTAAAIAICLLIGAVGKSAQLPLHTWLPDAMEGPTPVSALIHAATMVTAGVYMVVRNHAIYDLAPNVLLYGVGGIGAVTALFAATIGLVQTDIKRVLAYSTVSQLGFMFLACGVGAYVAAIFHLVTHAFFKALLFLSAGSVIHALSGEQDIRKMGGLWKSIPVTHGVFLIGTAAIAGFPFLSGWWSKDEILGHAFTHGHYILWVLGAVAAFFTAFYMSRLLYLTFYGQSHVDEHAAHHVHESPSVMLAPLVILALLAAIGGLIGVIPGGLENGAFHQFLRPVVSLRAGTAEAHETTMLPYMLMAVTTLIAFAGWLTAHYFYQLRPEMPQRLRQQLSAAYTLLLNKYWVDEIYDKVFVRTSKTGGRALDAVDTGVLDGAVVGVGRLTEMGAEGSTWVEKYVIYGGLNVIGYSNHLGARVLRKLQSGLVHHYATILVAGFVILVNLIVLFLWLGSGS